ncbi:hypothetical protein GGI43DRAFT_379000 [Trichoderma evansii]
MARPSRPSHPAHEGYIGYLGCNVMAKPQRDGLPFYPQNSCTVMAKPVKTQYIGYLGCTVIGAQQWNFYQRTMSSTSMPPSPGHCKTSKLPQKYKLDIRYHS